MADAFNPSAVLQDGLPPNDQPRKTVLILGLGGGTVARQLRTLAPDAAITGVDIDPGIVDLARRHMALDALGVEVVVGQADRFLAETGRRFDAIIDDLFLSGPADVVRSSIPTGETLALLKDRLGRWFPWIAAFFQLFR